MSLDNTIFIDTADSPEEVQRVLLLTTPFVIGDEVIEGVRQMVADGATIGFLKRLSHDDRASRCGVDAAYFLDISSRGNSREWRRLCGLAVVALLHAYPGDLLYIHLGYPALRRKDGRVILDRKAGIWEEGVEPDQLSMIDVPYEWGELPTL